jgi:hypothetical protein
MYLSVLMFMFFIVSSDTSSVKQAGTASGNFALLFLFVVANRGSVDGIVWFMLHDFSFLAVSSESLGQREEEVEEEEEEEDAQGLVEGAGEHDDGDEHGLPAPYDLTWLT